MSFWVAGRKECVLFPELGRLIERFHFVTHACMLHLKSKHLVHVKVRRLKDDFVVARLDLINLHKLAHGWLALRGFDAEVSLIWFRVNCYVLLLDFVDVVLWVFEFRLVFLTLLRLESWLSLPGRALHGRFCRW